MSAKSDSRLAEFLRRILAHDDGAAPEDVIFPDGATADVQRTAARQFAESVREAGHIGPEDDRGRVRVTPLGREWLDGYDSRPPGLHPRFTS